MEEERTLDYKGLKVTKKILESRGLTLSNKRNIIFQEQLEKRKFNKDVKTNVILLLGIGFTIHFSILLFASPMILAFIVPTFLLALTGGSKKFLKSIIKNISEIFFGKNFEITNPQKTVSNTSEILYNFKKGFNNFFKTMFNG